MLCPLATIILAANHPKRNVLRRLSLVESSRLVNRPSCGRCRASPYDPATSFARLAGSSRCELQVTRSPRCRARVGHPSGRRSAGRARRVGCHGSARLRGRARLIVDQHRVASVLEQRQADCTSTFGEDPQRCDHPADLTEPHCEHVAGTAGCASSAGPAGSRCCREAGADGGTMATPQARVRPAGVRRSRAADRGAIRPPDASCRRPGFRCRRMVSSLTGIPSRAIKRSAGRPPAAWPSNRINSARRSVLRISSSW